jgi:hypothetical protein
LHKCQPEDACVDRQMEKGRPAAQRPSLSSSPYNAGKGTEHQALPPGLATRPRRLLQPGGLCQVPTWPLPGHGSLVFLICQRGCPSMTPQPLQRPCPHPAQVPRGLAHSPASPLVLWRFSFLKVSGLWARPEKAASSMLGGGSPILSPQPTGRLTLGLQVRDGKGGHRGPGRKRIPDKGEPCCCLWEKGWGVAGSSVKADLGSFPNTAETNKI